MVVQLRGDQLTVAGLAVNQPLGDLPCIATHASRVAHLPPCSLVPESFGRFNPQARSMRGVPFGERVEVQGAQVWFVDSGHSASVQLLVEADGERVGVQLGAGTFGERCDRLVIDASYGLPIYRWPGVSELRQTLDAWLRASADSERTALLLGEPTDELRTVLALLGPAHAGKILAPTALLPLLSDAGAAIGPLPERGARKAAHGALVLAPWSELVSPTLPALGTTSLALASGRMRIRGARRRLAADVGLVLSSRADWPGLLGCCEASGAREVLTVGRHAAALAQALRTKGQTARPLEEAHR